VLLKSSFKGKVQKSIATWLRLTALILSIFISVTFCVAQRTSDRTHNQKIDEYGELGTDDEAARLDRLADRLLKEPDMRGCIVGYRGPRMKPGVYLRRIYGIGRYLTELRGIDPDRMLVIDGGYKDSFTTELWLVPKGETPPTPAPTRSLPPMNFSAPYKFDEECLECSLAVELYLYGMDEGLRFYAEVLRSNPTTHGLIAVRPGKEVTTRQAISEARKAKKRLVATYGIEPERINIRVRRRQPDNLAVAEMWLMPRRAR